MISFYISSTAIIYNYIQLVVIRIGVTTSRNSSSSSTKVSKSIFTTSRIKYKPTSITTAIVITYVFTFILLKKIIEAINLWKDENNWKLKKEKSEKKAYDIATELLEAEVNIEIE